MTRIQMNFRNSPVSLALIAIGVSIAGCVDSDPPEQVGASLELVHHLGGNSSYCGRSSSISYHGAFDPTKMWHSGFTPGSVSSVPNAKP